MEELFELPKRIEYKIDELHDLIAERDAPDAMKWLPEARVMYLLGLTKKTLARMRSEGKFRTSLQLVERLSITKSMSKITCMRTLVFENHRKNKSKD